MVTYNVRLSHHGYERKLVSRAFVFVYLTYASKDALYKHDVSEIFQIESFYNVL